MVVAWQGLWRVVQWHIERWEAKFGTESPFGLGVFKPRKCFPPWPKVPQQTSPTQSHLLYSLSQFQTTQGDT